MNMEAQTDRAVEAATDAAHDAYSDGGQFVYDKESWADCCADVILGDDESIEVLRKDIIESLDCMRRGIVPHGSALAIGVRVLKNAIDSGLTLETIGKVE